MAAMVTTPAQVAGQADAGQSATGARPTPASAYLNDLLERCAADTSGAVATYIPELAKADPEMFGIALVTVDGAVYAAGDAGERFTIQSLSKPLTYALALERLGEDAVRERVGIEPSGDAFNEISLAPISGRPLNPMINAGAIACAGLVSSHFERPFADLVDAYALSAGRRLELDEAVYLSESETGHRNRAIAHLLKNFGMVDRDPEDALDLYFRQCSLAVDCRDLATIAGTLANGGVNPVTGVRAVAAHVVRDVLSVMATCGMYNRAGEWLVHTGLPAKSGVSGGVLAVLPGRLGVAAWSPRLDEAGNSVRGAAAVRELSHDLGLHLITAGERPAPPVRSTATIAERTSKRSRPAEERDALREAAARTAVIEVQGDLGFTAVEAVSLATVERDGPPELVVLDLHRVARADAGGTLFLATLAAHLRSEGGRLALASAGCVTGSATPPDAEVFADLDRALEWCEDELLARVGHPRADVACTLAAHEALAGLDPDELERLDALLGRRHAAAGDVLVQSGAPAAEVFLVTRGALSVLARRDDGTAKRLTSVSAGMTFGEVAYVEGRTRSADVIADTDVELRTLTYAVLDILADIEPKLYGKLLRNLMRVVTGLLRAANAEAAQLAR